MDYYKYTKVEYGDAPIFEGEDPKLVKAQVISKTITVFTNDPEEIAIAPGKVYHMGKIDKKELDKLSKKPNVEVNSVK